MEINIKRKRYICVREYNGVTEIWGGQARNYSFRPLNELENFDIKTYCSERKAFSGCSYWQKDTDETFRVIEITEHIHNLEIRINQYD